MREQQQQPYDANVVGQRLSLHSNSNSNTLTGMIIAYFPKTQKHRVRLEGDNGSREKNVRLNEWTVTWLTTTTSQVELTPLQLAIRKDAVGRRLQVYNQVRQKWFQGTILKYVDHCQQHALTLEPQGKVHMVNLSDESLVWQYTDLLGLTGEESTTTMTLATSKYRGVHRHGVTTWKAYYNNDNTDTDTPIHNKYIGCFASEKDAALAYDVYARKGGTPSNFEDRRISKHAIKLLRVNEEEEEQQPPVIEATSSVDEQEEQQAPPLVEEKVESDDTTPELEEETEAPVEVEVDMIDMTKQQQPQPPVKLGRRISVDEEEKEDDTIHASKMLTSKKAASAVQEDSEFEFDEDFDDDQETDEPEETSSSSGSDDEEEVVVTPRKRSRKHATKKKNKLTVFEESSDEEEEERLVQKAMGRKRALMELQSFNSPSTTTTEQPKKRKRKRPVWPVGTKFVKEFPEFGTFQGRITEWDGKHYHVYYSEDDDQEELSEYEFDNYEILSVPNSENKSRLLSLQKKRRRKQHKRRKQARSIEV